MAKQSINVGTTANDRKGDSLRAAFQKVNANFTELYVALGLDSGGLNLGAFEFTGSVISTTDSTPVVIDQAVTVTSDLTVSGDIVPSVANGGNLGSAAKPFRSLYVSNNTVFLGGTPIGLEAGTNELTINNVPISQTITYADIPNVPTDLSDLTDTQGLLGQGGGANTGDITFTDATISAGANDEIIVQAQDANGFATARLNLEPEYSTAKLSAFSGESVNTYTLANGDFATGVWQDNGFGNGVVAFTGAQSIGDLFQNTIFSLNPNNVTIQINSEPAFTWNGGASGGGTSTPGFGTNPIVPASPITITTITFTYRRESYISVNYDNQEVRIDAQNAGIRMDANNTIQIYGDNEIDLQAATTFRIAAEEDINIGTGGAYAVRVSGGDFVVGVSDDVDIRGRDSFRLRNDSAVAPIRIITDDDNNSYTWAFNPDGTLTIPGDLRSETDINIDINLSDSTLRRWTFTEGGDLMFPDGTVQSTAFSGGEVSGLTNNDDINININNDDSSTYTWNFGNTGDLTLPADGDLNFGENGRFIKDCNNSTEVTSMRWINVVEDSNSTQLIRVYTGNPADDTDVERAQIKLNWQNADQSGLTIRSFDQDTGNDYDWEFRGDGNTEFPGNITAEGFIGIATENLRVESGKISLNSSKSESLFTDTGESYTSASWSGNNIDFTAVEDIYLETLLLRFFDHFDGSDTPWATGYSNITVEINGTQTLTVTGAQELGDGDWRVTVAETPASDPTAVTSAEFFYDFVSTLELDGNDNSYAIALDDSNFRINTRRDIRLESGDDVYIDGRSNMRLRNYSRTSGITIETDWNNSRYQWLFEENGNLTTPGDIIVAGDITGTSSASTLYLKAEPNSNTYIQLNDTVDSIINTVANLEIRTDVAGTAKTWNFDTDGNLTIPGDIRSENAINIDINLSDSTTRTWRFGEDGNLTFPDGANYAGQTVTMPTTPSGNTNSFVWEFSDNVIGSDTITLNWNLLASDSAGFYIGTTHSTNGKYLFLDGNDQSLSYIAGGVPVNSKIIFGSPAGNNAGDSNAIEIKGVDGDVYLTSSESVKITVDAADSSAQVWTFDPTGELTLPGTLNTTSSIDTTTSINWKNGNGAVINYNNIDNFFVLRVNDNVSKYWKFHDSGLTETPGDITATGTITGNIFKIDVGAQEKLGVTAGYGGGVENFDCSLGHITYNTSVGANWTVNLVNLNLDEMRATTITIVIEQGATGYYPDALQIAGVAETINWQGNTTPTPSSNRTDVVTFSIVRHATGFGSGYTVLGQLTGF